MLIETMTEGDRRRLIKDIRDMVYHVDEIALMYNISRRTIHEVALGANIDMSVRTETVLMIAKLEVKRDEIQATISRLSITKGVIDDNIETLRRRAELKLDPS